jgi:FkbM family methyltransferase
MSNTDGSRMLQSLIRDSAVRLFALMAKLRLDRIPGFNRVFLACYAIYKRYFEAGPIDRLKDFVPEGCLVIDVGANVGFFTLRFARWVGESGQVVAIEPEARNYDSLISALTRANVRHRVRALQAVAAAAPGTMLLEINPLHPADHKLSRDGSGLPVSAVTIDELVRDKGHLRPALVKIDVQGAEMLVLTGASGILRTAGPTLFIELHEEGLHRFGTSVSAILEYLSQYGYEPYWLMRTGPPTKTTPAEIHLKVARIGYVDVLFLRLGWS